MQQEFEELQEVDRFSIFYDADDNELSIHKMDAFFLGQAIQQVATMVKQAGRLLGDEDEEDIEVKVTVPAQEGSFAVEFAVYAAAHAREIVPALGLLGGGALALAQRLRNRKVVNIRTEDGSDEAVITVQYRGNEEEIICNKDEAILATDPVIRKAYNEIITQPLVNKDAPVFRVEVAGEEVLRLDGEDDIEFAPLPRKSLTFDHTERFDAVIAVTQVNFTSANGWRMTYQDEDRAFKMEDTGFMERVLNRGQSFVKGDLFSVRLRVKTIEKPDSSIKTTYAVEEVYRHLADEGRRLT
ncbi:hypothetical protein SR86_12455 [Enterobacter hormaechei subsp. xiangfangensis]|uniref:hypothetical protein n=1 Tax=Enterobacter hormaechei TaxID=158836 RepID=UPI0005EFF14B|nr:hypothetical protein [Enterobacter hormaechei]KJO32784.1 hypothetical protein SS01_08275 [Enterobacter hormaechei subsp. xiangfangensis]KJO88011.1 hypothetical protein SR86_12455 [Enterobacter hormaechei subsp. xiangfangensis]KJP01930.1 hypothetical protein SR95_12525 [Enterobacter hormaechei subsp. xiangfangensis]